MNSKVLTKHLRFIKNNYLPISVDKISHRRKRSDKIEVILTFDDGFRNNYEVAVPLLKKFNIPAVFFISTRHCERGKYLWFSYLSCLKQYFPGNDFKYKNNFIDMSFHCRSKNIKILEDILLNIRPHPKGMYDAIDNELPRLKDFTTQSDIDNYYSGMTQEMISEIASDDLFTIGVHTVDHPFLTFCDIDEIQTQIKRNKDTLESFSGHKVIDIAYPAGDFDERVIHLSKENNLKRGFACGDIINKNKYYEYQRTGIHHYPAIKKHSLDILGFKVVWSNYLRKMRLHFG
jgi:peptidoglycan/xylan/chitin deacetylase (PgdA/CDA1 family)